MDLPLTLGFAAAVVVYGWAWDMRHMAEMVLAAIACVLWFAARLQLGASFAVLPKAKVLVTTGLYSKFRNPVYLFDGLAYGGLLIAWAKAVPDCLPVLYPPYRFFRARKEAQVLEKAFGEKYRRYKAGTWL